MKRIHNFLIAVALLILSTFLLSESINSVGDFTKIGFGDTFSFEEESDKCNTSCSISCEGGFPQNIDIFEIERQTDTSYLRTGVGEQYDRGWTSSLQDGVEYYGEYRTLNFQSSIPHL